MTGSESITSFLPPRAVQRSPNSINADSQLVDVAGHHYHLQTTSPAIDSGLPSAGLDPAIDFEGTARPQGAAKDIGAYERVP